MYRLMTDQGVGLGGRGWLNMGMVRGVWEEVPAVQSVQAMA